MVAAPGVRGGRRARGRSREAAFSSFRLSHYAGFVLWLGIVLDYALRTQPAAAG